MMAFCFYIGASAVKTLLLIGPPPKPFLKKAIANLKDFRHTFTNTFKLVMPSIRKYE